MNMAGDRVESPCKIFVKGLASELDEKGLEAAFGRYGRIIGVSIVRDRETKQSRGFGFVSFECPEDCHDATQDMNGKELNGSVLVITPAIERPGVDMPSGAFRGGRGGRGMPPDYGGPPGPFPGRGGPPPGPGRGQPPYPPGPPGRGQPPYYQGPPGRGQPPYYQGPPGRGQPYPPGRGYHTGPPMDPGQRGPPDFGHPPYPPFEEDAMETMEPGGPPMGQFGGDRGGFPPRGMMRGAPRGRGGPPRPGMHGEPMDYAPEGPPLNPDYGRPPLDAAYSDGLFRSKALPPAVPRGAPRGRGGHAGMRDDVSTYPFPDQQIEESEYNADYMGGQYRGRGMPPPRGAPRGRGGPPMLENPSGYDRPMDVQDSRYQNPNVDYVSGPRPRGGMPPPGVGRGAPPDESLMYGREEEGQVHFPGGQGNIPPPGTGWRGPPGEPTGYGPEDEVLENFQDAGYPDRGRDDHFQGRGMPPHGMRGAPQGRGMRPPPPGMHEEHMDFMPQHEQRNPEFGYPEPGRDADSGPRYDSRGRGGLLPTAERGRGGPPSMSPTASQRGGSAMGRGMPPRGEEPGYPAWQRDQAESDMGFDNTDPEHRTYQPSPHVEYGAPPSRQTMDVEYGSSTRYPANKIPGFDDDDDENPSSMPAFPDTPRENPAPLPRQSPAKPDWRFPAPPEMNDPARSFLPPDDEPRNRGMPSDPASQGQHRFGELEFRPPPSQFGPSGYGQTDASRLPGSAEYSHAGGRRTPDVRYGSEPQDARYPGPLEDRGYANQGPEREYASRNGSQPLSRFAGTSQPVSGLPDSGYGLLGSSNFPQLSRELGTIGSSFRKPDFSTRGRPPFGQEKPSDRIPPDSRNAPPLFRANMDSFDGSRGRGNERGRDVGGPGDRRSTGPPPRPQLGTAADLGTRGLPPLGRFDRNAPRPDFPGAGSVHSLMDVKVNYDAASAPKMSPKEQSLSRREPPVGASDRDSQYRGANRTSPSRQVRRFSPKGARGIARASPHGGPSPRGASRDSGPPRGSDSRRPFPSARPGESGEPPAKRAPHGDPASHDAGRAPARHASPPRGASNRGYGGRRF